MFGRSPIFRICVGLVLLTVSLLLTGNYLLSFKSVQSNPALDARKKFCESLAVQLSILAHREEFQVIDQIIESVVARNDDVYSAGLRDVTGGLVASAGEHRHKWSKAPGDTSTPTHAQVPLFAGEKRWGTVEVQFAPIDGGLLLGVWKSPFFKLVAFVVLAGLVAYWLFMKKTLRHLDPSSVIPGRVQSTLDALAEGVLLLDDSERVVLANSAFVRMAGRRASAIAGKRASQLPWMLPNSDEPATSFPWIQTMKDAKGRTGDALTLRNRSDANRILMVNSSPILDENGAARGALVTFDDVTELDTKNTELQDMLTMLQRSRDEVNRQNEELQFLATRDPMTKCLNRRSFLERFEDDFAIAQGEGRVLSCIMCDIDHFKSVNDNYGHAAGDEVITRVAEILRATLRATDAICRYGGEEFCVMLPDMSIDKASEAAERLRQAIEEEDSLQVSATASFGVSALRFGAKEPSELIDQADQALYRAKNAGRNRVTRWDDEIEAISAKTRSASEA